MVHLQTGWQVETTESMAPGTESSDDLTRFVDQHLRRIYLQIYRIVRNPSDAQDLTQEAFIKAWRRREQLRDGQKADAWLSSIARNTALDFLRRKSPAMVPDDGAMDRSRDDNPEQILLRAESRSRLSAGLRYLTEREQTALILRDVEGVEAAEVAKILGCSKATVRCHIANAREKFRRYLKREELRQSRPLRKSIA
jgi:RNA polymerase sigma-70 factor (ECF subfamily)